MPDCCFQEVSQRLNLVVLLSYLYILQKYEISEPLNIDLPVLRRTLYMTKYSTVFINFITFNQHES